MKSSFITQFFDKDPTDIGLADIESFFQNPQEEGSTLEFKSGHVEIITVFKEIVAFLNTEGGLLIIGAPQEQKKTQGKRTYCYCQGELTYSSFASKDWLRQKIYSNITPSPTDIFIKEISTAKGNIFILDIPQSFNPPHQSNADGRYYIRIDNEAKPAPHGLVQALFEGRRKPQLFARLDRRNLDPCTDSIMVSVANKTIYPADKVCVSIDVYNVESVEDDKFEENFEQDLGQRFSFSDLARQVLVRVASLKVCFNVIFSKKKYLITVCYWSKEVDFNLTYFIIDTANNQTESFFGLDSPDLLYQISNLNNSDI